jgi:hypothetical protein
MKREYNLNMNYTGSILWLTIGLFFFLISIFAILDEELFNMSSISNKDQLKTALASYFLGGIGFIASLFGVYGIYASIVIDDFKLTITETGLFFPEIRDRSITFYDYSDITSWEIVENQIDKKHALNALEFEMKYNRRVCIANTLFSNEEAFEEAVQLIISNIEKRS